MLPNGGPETNQWFKMDPQNELWEGVRGRVNPPPTKSSKDFDQGSTDFLVPLGAPRAPFGPTFPQMLSLNFQSESGVPKSCTCECFLRWVLGTCYGHFGDGLWKDCLMLLGMPWGTIDRIVLVLLILPPSLYLPDLAAGLRQRGLSTVHHATRGL